jgi:hypothetical protein
MSDVRFILGISPEEKAGPNAVNRKKRKFEVTSDTKNKKKKTGLAREVANLAIQGSTGALFKIDEPVVAEKPKIHRPNRWVQMPISSTANRQFVSKHWTKANEKPGDYYFAKYSKKNLSIKFTDQEYRQQFHQGKDNVDNWTKEETDYLVEQCERFECKFIVIKDRWIFNGPSRSVEDIKARFYFIREKLERLHYGTLERNPFDKEKEILRKKQIEILNNRPLSTQKEEESLLPRYSSLMAAFKEHQSESKKIIKLAQNTLQTKKKKNSRAPLSKSGQSKDLSAKVLKYSGAIQSALNEMGIQKPNASDTAGLQKYSDMRSDICILLELQRIEAEALYELQVLKGHKAMLANTDIPIVSIDPFLPDVNGSLLPVTFGQPGNEEYDGEMGDYEDDYEHEVEFSDESDYGEEEDYDVLR